MGHHFQHACEKVVAVAQMDEGFAVEFPPDLGADGRGFAEKLGGFRRPALAQTVNRFQAQADVLRRLGQELRPKPFME